MKNTTICLLLLISSDALFRLLRCHHQYQHAAACSTTISWYWCCV